jgi:hypothetical protein
MATTFLKVKNNAESTLASDISDAATSLTVASSEGAKFPSTFPFPISIDDEIIKVGARSGDTLSSLTRGQEGTSAVAHSSGASVELRITAEQMSDIHTAVNTLEDASHVLNVTTITSNATLTSSQTVVLCDASSGAITVTLPAASGNDGRHYHIKKIDSSGNAVTIDGNGSETIDGETTQAVAVQYNSIQIVCDGSEWHIL